MTYRIKTTSEARRDLRKIPLQVRERISHAIDALATEPRPHGVTKLTGYQSTWRIRVGDYRVIYEIHDDVLTVLIVEAGHRREIYRPH